MKALSLFIFLLMYSLQGQATLYELEEEGHLIQALRSFNLCPKYLEGLETLEHQLKTEGGSSAITSAARNLRALTKDPTRPYLFCEHLSSFMALQAVNCLHTGSPFTPSLLQDLIFKGKAYLTDNLNSFPAESSLNTLCNIGVDIFTHHFEGLQAYHTLYYKKYSANHPAQKKSLLSKAKHYQLCYIFEAFFNTVLKVLTEECLNPSLNEIFDIFSSHRVNPTREVTYLRNLHDLVKLSPQAYLSESLVGDMASLHEVIREAFKALQETANLVRQTEPNSSLNKLLLQYSQGTLNNLVSLIIGRRYRALYLPLFMPEVKNTEGKVILLQHIHLHNFLNQHPLHFLTDIHSYQSQFYQSVLDHTACGLKVYPFDKRDAGNIFVLANTCEKILSSLQSQLDAFYQKIWTYPPLKGDNFIAFDCQRSYYMKQEGIITKLLSFDQQQKILQSLRKKASERRDSEVEQGINLLTILTDCFRFLACSTLDLEKGRLAYVCSDGSCSLSLEKKLWQALKNHPLAHRLESKVSENSTSPEGNLYRFKVYADMEQQLKKLNKAIVELILLKEFAKREG